MTEAYFASDFHLGIDARETSLSREKRLCRWLDQIASRAESIYLLGDLFDFWFEYRSVVPRGYVRLLGRLTDLSDQGIPVHIFTGNHDMWLGNYLEDLLGTRIIRQPVIHDIQGKRVYLAHGDGLGPGDYGYKLIKGVFANPLCQWLFARLHPNLAFALARYWSHKSRASAYARDRWRGAEHEWLIAHATACLQQLSEQETPDYFVYGHRHLPIDYTLHNGKSRYINLGDWLEYSSYAVMREGKLHLEFFENEEGIILGS